MEKADPVSPAEKEWLKVRSQETRRAINAFLNRETKRQPRVAVLSSGGGVRAMVAMFGVLDGKKKKNQKGKEKRTIIQQPKKKKKKKKA